MKKFLLVFSFGILLILLYIPLSIWANYGLADELLKSGADLGCPDALACSFSLSNPVLPSINQLLIGLNNLTFPLFSPNSAFYNALITLLEALTGFVAACLLGSLLSVALFFSKSFNRMFFPWIVTSQLVPIVALAPMLAVLLGQYGVQGVLPKILIACYLAFLPICLALFKGISTIEPLKIDLLQTYSANRLQTLLKLRLPQALPYFLTACKVSIAAALVGAMIAEISTISFSGLGKMLAENSRASDAVGLWVIMIYAAILGFILVQGVSLLERRLNLNKK